MLPTARKYFSVTLLLCLTALKLQEAVPINKTVDILQSIEQDVTTNATNSSCPEKSSHGGMFSPKENVYVSCTPSCPLGMYISTPCSAEKDTQCSVCPTDPFLWDCNMQAECHIAMENTWTEVFSDVWTFLLHHKLFMISMVIFGCFCFIWSLLPKRVIHEVHFSIGDENITQCPPSKLACCFKRCNGEKSVKYTAVASGDKVTSDMSYEMTPVSEAVTNNELAYESTFSENSVKENEVQAEQTVFVEMNPCIKQADAIFMSEKTGGSLENLCEKKLTSSVSSSRLASETQSQSDTSSVVSILGKVHVDNKDFMSIPILNDGQHETGPPSVSDSEGIIVATRHPVDEQHRIDNNSDRIRRFQTAAHRESPKDAGHLDRIQYFKKYCGSLTSLEDRDGTPILDRKRDMKYCSSSSLSSAKTSIASDVSLDKIYDV